MLGLLETWYKRSIKSFFFLTSNENNTDLRIPWDLEPRILLFLIQFYAFFAVNSLVLV